jgi:predicted transposase YdaD
MIEPTEREEIMQIVTSWMEQGIEQGIERERKSLILRLLTRRVGPVPNRLTTTIQSLSLDQLEALGEALLDFTGLADVEAWLQQHPPT